MAKGNNAFVLDSLEPGETAALEADAATEGTAFSTERQEGAQPARQRVPVQVAEPVLESQEGTNTGEDQTEGTEGEVDPSTAEVGAEVPPKQGMVPHAAMHEERERRKEAERVNAVLTERTTRILEMMAAGQAQQQAPAQQATAPAFREVPNYDADPAGHIAALLHNQQVTSAQHTQAITQLMQSGQGNAQAVAQAQQTQQIMGRAGALENEFKTTNPDYETALNFVVNQRHEELKALGVSDAAQRNNILQQEAFGIAARSVQDNSNPAQILYNFALARGYKKAPIQQVTALQPGNGAERITRVAAGAKANGPTLSGAGGGARPTLTVAALLAMPASEFERMVATPQGRALMGD